MKRLNKSKKYKNRYLALSKDMEEIKSLIDKKVESSVYNEEISKLKVEM